MSYATSISNTKLISTSIHSKLKFLSAWPWNLVRYKHFIEVSFSFLFLLDTRIYLGGSIKLFISIQNNKIDCCKFKELMISSFRRLIMDKSHFFVCDNFVKCIPPTHSNSNDDVILSSRLTTKYLAYMSCCQWQ